MTRTQRIGMWAAVVAGLGGVAAAQTPPAGGMPRRPPPVAAPRLTIPAAKLDLKRRPTIEQWKALATKPPAGARDVGGPRIQALAIAPPATGDQVACDQPITLEVTLVGGTGPTGPRTLYLENFAQDAINDQRSSLHLAPDPTPTQASFVVPVEAGATKELTIYTPWVLRCTKQVSVSSIVSVRYAEVAAAPTFGVILFEPDFARADSFFTISPTAVTFGVKPGE